MSNVSALVKDITAKPSQAFIFLWADYIELKCLLSGDKLYNSGFFYDMEMGGDHEDYGVTTDSEYGENTGLNDDDLTQSKWLDVKRAMNSRRHRLKESWPFKLEGDQVVFCYDKNNKRQTLYLLLLICSALKFFHRSRHNEITGAFELIGYEVFLKIMPGWVVKPFGAHQSIANGYTGTMAQKIKALSEDIIPRSCANDDDFDARDTGDGGLDLIAYKSFSDGMGHIPVAFGQCGCSPTAWEYKQLEASPAAVSAMISPHHPAANYYFMPHDFRDFSGVKWAKPAKVGEVILVDRERIINILSSDFSENALSTATSLVEEAVSTEISYFN